MAPEKNTKQTRDTRFKRGQSGNPKGRRPGSKNKPKTLPLAQAITAAELARLGRSPRQIARLLKAKPEAVKEALAQSRRLLETCAPQFAEHWLVASRNAALDGDHKPAMAALQSIEVIKPIAQTYDTGNSGKAAAFAGVKVELHGFYCAGLPGLPSGLSPKDRAPAAIDITASTSTP